MIRYGALKACTNVYYSGGSAIGSVSAAVTYNICSKIARNLLANHASMITSILAPSSNFATTPVEAGFLVFCHTDLEHDIRQLSGFKHVSEYGQRKVMHEMELGSVGRFRFIVSPELASTPDVGAAVGATGLLSTSSSLIDVYPLIVVAEDAWGDVALRGANSFDPTWIPPGQKDKNDPLGQRGYVGAKFYDAAKVLNDGWMAVAYVGATSL
jgi:N4-gp56 family major capsid protein